MSFEENITIDARKKECPLPLILLKKGLKKNKDGFILIIDNKIAKENIERFLSENEIAFECLGDNETYKFFVNTLQHNTKEAIIKAKVHHLQADTAIGKHIICIKSDKMGNGSDELGEILLKAFVNNLKEVFPLPSTIIFYNSGIMLTLSDSAIIDSLKELKSRGVKIFICGACVDYYNVENRIGIGVISNMFEITELLTRASHVIYP